MTTSSDQLMISKIDADVQNNMQVHQLLSKILLSLSCFAAGGENSPPQCIFFPTAMGVPMNTFPERKKDQCTENELLG